MGNRERKKKYREVKREKMIKQTKYTGREMERGNKSTNIKEKVE